MKVALLIPTLNEVEGIKAIMPRIKKEWVDEIIFIDGNSTDGTVEYIRQHGHTLISEKRPGVRHALVETIDNIESNTIITFSPDGNCIPELIPELIEKIKEGYDMVIASRYLDGAKSYDDNLITAFGNWLLTKTINLLHGAKYTDAMVIFRAYKTKLIYDLELHKDEGYATAEKLFNTHISWEPLLSVRAAKRRLKIAEIAGDEPARIGGQRKLDILRWGAAYYFQFIREWFLREASFIENNEE